MSADEKDLLAIAREVVNMNKDLGAALTGSLMLANDGIDKRREATDIDIICDFLRESGEGYPSVPTGFRPVGRSGRGSAVNSIQFVNAEGVKLDFMYSEEVKNFRNGILCGSVKMLMLAKTHFGRDDKTEESRHKHLDDLAYLLARNSVQTLFGI